MACNPHVNDLFGPSPGHDPGGRVRYRVNPQWKVGALFSGEGACYREKLMHRWGDGPAAMIAMMNPSVADYRVLDPTVAKTARLAKQWGYGAQVVVNACAYRATDKLRLLEVKDPVGRFNLEAIRIAAESVDLIVVAHGQLPKGLQKHADAMVNMLLKHGHTLHVLKLSKGGIPYHPLLIPMPEAEIKPLVWKTPNQPP